MVEALPRFVLYIITKVNNTWVNTGAAVPCPAVPSHRRHIAITSPSHCHHIAVTFPSHCRHIAVTLPSTRPSQLGEQTGERGVWSMRNRLTTRWVRRPRGASVGSG